MKGQTFYASKSGVEVRGVTSAKRRGGYEERSGKIRIRAFSMENGRDQVRILLSPAEAHKLGRTVKSIFKTAPEKGVTVIVHKSQKDKKESTSRIIVDYFKTKKGTEGVGLVVVRDSTKINTPLSKDDALYFADLLIHLSLEQSWFSSKKVEEVEETEEEEVVEEDAFPEEEEDIELT